MRLIVDTHALLWWWLDSPRLTDAAVAALENQANDILVSTVSIYEYTAKFGLGKLPEAKAVVENLEMLMMRSAFVELPITHAHARAAGLLPGPHRDPFDRLLIAQAQIEKASIVSADPVFAVYGAATVW